MEKLYTAVIGVGHLGSKHAKVYSSLRSASLVGVSDTNEERGKRTAHKYHTKYYSEYRDLFDKVEAVSIAVPTFLHYKIAKDFLDHGIHVLIEKPITKTIEEADELLALAKKKNLIIQVGHIERFNSAVIAIEPFIKEPRFIECNRLGPFVPSRLACRGDPRSGRPAAASGSASSSSIVFGAKPGGCYPAPPVVARFDGRISRGNPTDRTARLLPPRRDRWFLFENASSTIEGSVHGLGLFQWFPTTIENPNLDALSRS